MSVRYPQHGYPFYGIHQWPANVKPEFVDEDDDEVEDDDEPYIVDDKALDATSPNMIVAHDNQQHSVKVEDDFASSVHMWQDRPLDHMPQGRLFSQPTINTNTSMVTRLANNHHGSPYGPQPWLSFTHSQSTTPTPMYSTISNGFPQSIQYPSTPAKFGQFPPTDPSSAVSMSPQSSQGGWGSNHSSDAAEQRSHLRSPRYRPMSPMTVQRSDGIRKKNARFEIPKERNLNNIDKLIERSTDEAEKKELKQQKRLLRNRQAALDSRQRKKTHTEHLEQEKKIFAAQKAELEEAVDHVKNTLEQEREQWRQQQQQYEAYLQSFQYERDEAIRTKTLETTELRRMNNVLKDYIRELERQQSSRVVTANHNHETFTSDFNSFGIHGLDDHWDDEFNFIDNEDLRMDGVDSPRRDATPRPPQISDAKLDVKQDTGFSWNTFYMCLLFGAFVASNANLKDNINTAASSSTIPTSIPSLSEDYRAEAGNVLKAVLASVPDSTHELLPQPSTASDILPLSTTADHTSNAVSQHDQGSLTLSLDALHDSLTAPTRQQAAAAALSLSISSYNHVINPEGILDDDNDNDESDIVKTPTRLQQLFANMQAVGGNVDRLGGRAKERSVLLDHVPEKVLRDFKQMIGLNDALQTQQ